MSNKMWKFGVILFAVVLFLSSCCGDCGEHRAGVTEAVGEVVSEETWERYVEDYLLPLSCDIAP